MRTESPRRTRWLLRVAALVALCLPPSTGCLFMTPHGQPVVVERTTQDDLWDGNGMLVERTADGAMCKVKVRDSLGVVVSRWYDCQYIHYRMR